jgi:hypothetical protein
MGNALILKAESVKYKNYSSVGCIFYVNFWKHQLQTVIIYFYKICFFDSMFILINTLISQIKVY